MKKLVFAIAVLAALLLTAWSSYRLTMKQLQIETAPGGVVYVSGWGMTDIYKIEGAEE